MLSNLFSIFDPSTSLINEMNWMSLMYNLLLNPMFYWFLPSRIEMLFKMIILSIYKELKILTNNKFNWMNIIFLISIMMTILLNNFMGLMPYIFTSSSHLIFSLSISLPMWLSLMLFSYMNNMNFMFSHLIPPSTPNLLMPFMVIIETISNLIRPGTLAIRLTANMIAGHLLLTLLSQSSLLSNSILLMLIILTQIMLLMLEFSVSIIQSYVFMILSTLYSKETNYD